MTMKQFFWLLDAKAVEREDQWDYVRHIIAGSVGKSPEKIMRLPRDRVVITEDLQQKAKDYLLKARLSNGN